MGTLTRKDQVLAVLHAGGHVHVPIKGTVPRIAKLFTVNGEPVPAWQQAITACLSRETCTARKCSTPGVIQWRLK